MKCLLVVSNNTHSKHKAGFIIFHPERNNLISKFCPLTSYSWSLINHISDFGLIYVPPRTKQKLKKESAYIYIVGGYDNIKKMFSRKILRYDMIRGEWFHCAKMKIRRANFTPFLYDGKLYFAGGQTSKIMLTDSVEYYEPLMDLVYEAKRLPFPCSNYSCAFMNKNVFIIGGNIQRRNGIIHPSSHFWSFEKSEEIVSEETQIPEIVLQWTNINEAKIPVQEGIIGHKAVICKENNRIYVIGGTNHNNDTETAVAGLYYTDISAILNRNTQDPGSTILWYKRVFSGIQRCNSGVSLINNKIFVVGGSVNNFNSTFSIPEVNEDENMGIETPVRGLRQSQPPFLIPVNETIGYYDWRRKIFCETFKLRHMEDIDLENVQSVVIDMENHYLEFKKEKYDWILQWPLW